MQRVRDEAVTRTVAAAAAAMGEDDDAASVGAHGQVARKDCIFGGNGDGSCLCVRQLWRIHDGIPPSCSSFLRTNCAAQRIPTGAEIAATREISCTIQTGLKETAAWRTRCHLNSRAMRYA